MDGMTSDIQLAEDFDNPRLSPYLWRARGPLTISDLAFIAEFFEKQNIFHSLGNTSLMWKDESGARWVMMENADHPEFRIDGLGNLVSVGN
jgi:hypothetical protein